MFLHAFLLKVESGREVIDEGELYIGAVLALIAIAYRSCIINVRGISH